MSFFNQRNFGTKHFLIQKICWVKKVKKKFGINKFLAQKIFESKEALSKKKKNWSTNIKTSKIWVGKVLSKSGTLNS